MKKNKVILTSDIHLRMYADISYDDRGIPLKLVEIISAVEQMAEYAMENSIDSIFILGDINDMKSNVSTRAFLLFSDMMEKYNNIKWYLIGGNHDLCGNVSSSNFSSIELFKGRKNVEIFITPQEISFKDNSILLLPYYNFDYIKSVLKQCKSSKIVFGHLGLGDASISSGISISSPFNSSDFKKFKFVFLGHYHKPQSIKNGGTEVVYVGSPIQLRRDEINEEKRFIVFDFDNLSYISIPTCGYRKYYELVVDEDMEEEDVKDKIEELKKMNFIVTVKLKKLFSKSFLESLDGCSVVGLTEDNFKQRGILTSMTLEEKMKKYLELSGIDSSLWEKYFNVGLDVVKNR